MVGTVQKRKLSYWDVWRNYSSTGYKVLDSHIGAIYGDSINYDRAKKEFLRDRR
jgi:hypothetical protein